MSWNDFYGQALDLNCDELHEAALAIIQDVAILRSEYNLSYYQSTLLSQLRRLPLDTLQSIAGDTQLWTDQLNTFANLSRAHSCPLPGSTLASVNSVAQFNAAVVRAMGNSQAVARQTTRAFQRGY